MPGKRPRPAMRRTTSVSQLLVSGSNDCSPLPEHAAKEKQRSTNFGAFPAPTSVPPRQVIGFHPKVTIDEEQELVLPSPPQLVSPPRQLQGKPPTGSSGGSPRSGLGDLLAGPRPWGRRDEGVGLGIVAALDAVSQEDGGGKRNVDFAHVQSYSRKMTPPHLPSVFTPPRTSPIPIHSSSPNSLGTHHCPSVPRHTKNCGPRSGLSSAMQESMNHSVSSSHRGGYPGRVNQGAAPIFESWSDLTDTEEDAVVMVPVGPPPPSVSRHSFRPLVTAGYNFLESCVYCNRRLEEGRDIYIYRGDKTFCTSECRHQQILIDQWLEKCSAANKSGRADGSRRTIT